MKNSKSLIMAAILIAAGTTIIGVSANTNNNTNTFNKINWEERRAQMQEDRAKLDTAIEESGSFDSFKEQVAELPMAEKLLEKVNADNFEKFVEAHDYQKQGMALLEKSRGIMKELGFERPMMKENPGMMKYLKRHFKNGQGSIENDSESTDKN